MNNSTIQTSRKIYTTKKGEQVIEAYDAFYPVMDDLTLELLLYRRYLFGKDQDTQKCLFHLKNAHDLAFPEYAKTWCDWDEDAFRAHVLPGNELIGYAGPGGTGKSHRCARLAVIFYLSAPTTARVAVTSTTVVSAAARAWGYIKDLSVEAGKIWSWVKLDKKSSPDVYFYPTEAGLNYQACMILAPTLTGASGREERTLSTIIGVHPIGGYLLIVDECNFMPLSLLTAFSNLRKGTPWFQAHGIANPLSKIDVHGLMCEPDESEGGWAGVDIQKRKQWKTSRGVGIYLDPYDSPAIHHPDAEVKEMYRTIRFPTAESIDADKRMYGDMSLEFWSQTLGLWPPTSSEPTVLDMELVNNRNILHKPEWQPTEPRIIIGAIDPAFSETGGDKCYVQFAELGYTVKGVWTLAFTTRYDLKRVIGTAEDGFTQVARQCAEVCRKEGVLGKHFGVEAHGSGMGLPTVLLSYWPEGADFMRIDGSFSASDDVVDAKLGTTAKQVYNRKITEMYMNIRKFTMSQQIRNIPMDCVAQLCERRVFSPPVKSKTEVEDKRSFSKKLGSLKGRAAISPDASDCVACVIEVAVRALGFKTESEKAITERKKYWTSDPYFHDRIRAINHMWDERKGLDIVGEVNKKMFGGKVGMQNKNAYRSSVNIKNRYKKAYR